MKISIVMPNHNRVEALKSSLESLTQQTFPPEQFEVLVVDQASDDGSRQLVANFSTPFSLKLIEQNAKYGISIARNAGIEAAANPFVILLDSDIIADSGLVEAHSCLHEQNRSPILGCGRLLPFYPSYSSFIEEVANPEGGLDRGVDKEDFPFYFAFGGHLSFSVDTFRRVGTFATEINGYEDIEFAYRAFRLGIGIKNCREAIGYHNHHRSMMEYHQRSFDYFRAIPLVFRKHPELKGIIPGLRSMEPLQVGSDSSSILLAKIKASFWSSTIIRKGILTYLLWADRNRAYPRITKFLFYRLYHGDRRAGLLQGLRDLEGKKP